MKKKFIAIVLACVFALTLSSNAMAAVEVHDAMILYYHSDYFGYTEAKNLYPEYPNAGFSLKAKYLANGSLYDSGESLGNAYGWAYWQSIGWNAKNSVVEIHSYYYEPDIFGHIGEYSSYASDYAIVW